MPSGVSASPKTARPVRAARQRKSGSDEPFASSCGCRGANGLCFSDTVPDTADRSRGSGLSRQTSQGVPAHLYGLSQFV